MKEADSINLMRIADVLTRTAIALERLADLASHLSCDKRGSVYKCCLSLGHGGPCAHESPTGEVSV